VITGLHFGSGSHTPDGRHLETALAIVGVDNRDLDRNVKSNRGRFLFQEPPILRSMAKRRKANAPSRTYSIYVIELARTCLRTPSAYAPLYVGQTAHTPEHRFTQHKSGGKLAAGKPHKFGVRLRYDLMKAISPLSTRREAERAEKAVAEALEKRGHKVFWG
jgi:hypothetical protein